MEEEKIYLFYRVDGPKLNGDGTWVPEKEIAIIWANQIYDDVRKKFLYEKQVREEDLKKAIASGLGFIFPEGEYKIERIGKIEDIEI